MKIPVYLDYNATTPLDPIVASAMEPFLYEAFGNPSSGHSYGLQARLAIESARRQVAEMLNARNGELVFTGGGTEANNMAIRGYCLQNRERGNHIITTAIEHPAVLEVCRSLAEEGFTLSVLPVDNDGLVFPAALQAAIQPETILVSVMHANNEVGTIQPVRELVDIAHRAGAIFHCDAAQSVGKIRVDVEQLGVDLLSLAGHKFYGPKGIGVLYIRTGTELAKITLGAGHENNRRPGTENTLAIVGIGSAAQLVQKDLQRFHDHFGRMRDRLARGLIQRLGEERVRINGHEDRHLPNTLSVSFRHLRANEILHLLNPQVAASAGAACHADQVSISSVLSAMRVPVEWAMGTLRFSTGRTTSTTEIDFAVDAICRVVDSLTSKA